MDLFLNILSLVILVAMTFGSILLVRPKGRSKPPGSQN
jgi:hypothetical protein